MAVAQGAGRVCETKEGRVWVMESWHLVAYRKHNDETGNILKDMRVAVRV